MADWTLQDKTKLTWLQEQRFDLQISSKHENFEIRVLSNTLLRVRCQLNWKLEPNLQEGWFNKKKLIHDVTIGADI